MAGREEKDFKLSSIVKDCASALRLLGPDKGVPASGGRTTLTLAIEPNVLPLQFIDIVVNGHEVRARKLRSAKSRMPEGFDIKAYDIPLFTGANEITVSAQNEAGVSEKLVLHTYHQGMVISSSARSV